MPTDTRVLHYSLGALTYPWIPESYATALVLWHAHGYPSLTLQLGCSDMPTDKQVLQYSLGALTCPRIPESYTTAWVLWHAHGYQSLTLQLGCSDMPTDTRVLYYSLGTIADDKLCYQFLDNNYKENDKNYILLIVRGREDDLSFFKYLSPFCFLSIEFHSTFSISYKILPCFVYYCCI